MIEELAEDPVECIEAGPPREVSRNAGLGGKVLEEGVECWVLEEGLEGWALEVMAKGMTSSMESPCLVETPVYLPWMLELFEIPLLWVVL